MTRETRSSEPAASSGAPPDSPVRAEGAGAEGIASSGRTDAVSAGLVSGEERFAVPAHGGKAASMGLGRSRRPASPSAARRKRRSERAPVEKRAAGGRPRGRGTSARPRSDGDRAPEESDRRSRRKGGGGLRRARRGAGRRPGREGRVEGGRQGAHGGPLPRDHCRPKRRRGKREPGRGRASPASRPSRGESGAPPARKARAALQAIGREPRRAFAARAAAKGGGGQSRGCGRSRGRSPCGDPVRRAVLRPRSAGRLPDCERGLRVLERCGFEGFARGAASVHDGGDGGGRARVPGGVRSSSGLHPRADHLRERAGRRPLGPRRARQEPLRHQVVLLVPRVPRSRGQELMGDERGGRRPRSWALWPTSLRSRAIATGIVFRSRVLLSGPPYVGNALIREAIASCDSDRMAEGLKDAGYATSSELRRGAQSGDGRIRPQALRRDEPGGLQGGRRRRRRDRRRGGKPAGGAVRMGRVDSRGRPSTARGLTQWCYAQAGIDIPRYSEDQAASGKRVPLSEAEPGDILWRPGHVAIYVGGDEYIHEPRPGDRVQAGDGDRLLHLRRPLQIVKRQEDSHAEEEQGDDRRGHRHGRDSRRDDGQCAVPSRIPQARPTPTLPQPRSNKPAEQEGPETEPEAGKGTDEASAVLEELRGSAWTAADGSGKTLAFREGSFVESDGASVSMTAFEVEGSGSSGAQRWLDVPAAEGRGDAAGGSATIVLDEDDEVSSVACDGFSLSGGYVRTATSGGTVEVSGLAEPYPSLVDGRTDRARGGDLRVGHRARAHRHERLLRRGGFRRHRRRGASAPRSI